MGERTAAPTDVVDGSGSVKRLLFDRFALSVVTGPDAGMERTFGQALVQVGTARANDFVVTDRTVSRFHLRLETQGSTFVAVDLGSTNGTQIGGVRIREAYLDADTPLTLGSTVLRFRPVGDTASLELPEQDSLGGLIGRSARMRQLYALVARVAPSELSVIIEGETGTGKELVARSIHDTSPRASRPFEVLDCSAIPESLIESELFGHVKGAFTGADRDRAGIFERAHGGTVFLDEIGEIEVDLQPKLLRVLESRQLRRVGDSRTVDVDVRVVAATHRSLRRLVNEGTFREDLYYRLAGCRLELPPLRERTEDIPLLVGHFLARLRARSPALAVTPPDAETLQMLSAYPWPGNVRQLRNAVERLAVMGSLDLSGDAPDRRISLAEAVDCFVEMPLREAKEAFERGYLEALLRRHGGETQRAAQAAEIHYKSLLRMLRRNLINRP
jgi:DNA-binding NtrC family response regulator